MSSTDVISCSSKKKTICFGTVCKNEEHCILDALNSIYKYIDYWVVCDTGSTDNTVQIIQDFFKEKNIPGELHNDEWFGFAHNKTLLFERCYNKTDFMIHFDADDVFNGDLSIIHDSIDVKTNIAYYINIRRHCCRYKDYFLFNNRFKWRVIGAVHTIFKCINNYDNLPMGNLSNYEFYILSRDIGNMSNDKDKYYKDALLLKEQFFKTLLIDEDELNDRSIFYMAQSYFDSGNYKEACQWYRIYTKFKNVWIEQLYESYKKIVYCMIKLEYPCDKIVEYARKGIEVIPERSEIYCTMGNYFYYYEKYELAFFNIQKAYEMDYNSIKHPLFIDYTCYGKELLPLLTILAKKSGRNDLSLQYLDLITDFDKHKEITDMIKT